MAFNQQLLMHNMTVKGKRLTSGLERFVEAVEKGEDVTGFPYHYALGCLGGDFIAKKLMKTKWLPEVVDALVANSLMKQEKGEKLKAEWKEKCVTVESPVSRLASSPTSDVPSPTSSPVDADEKSASTSRVIKSASTMPHAADDNSDQPPTDVQPSIISFVYDEKTRLMDPSEGVPKPALGLFYAICDSQSATKYFPLTVDYRGKTWIRRSDEPIVGTSRIRISYQIES